MNKMNLTHRQVYRSKSKTYGVKPMDTKSLRAQIDEIDASLQKLVEDRMRLGLKVAELKSQQSNPQYFVPEREAQVLNNVRQRCSDDMPVQSVERIFKEIISATRALESPLKVAILGPEATFTHAAADLHFGHAYEGLFQATINDVFSAVEVGRAQFGVVPVENSIEGVVNHTLDCLLDSTLQLCGEIEMRVHHDLISNSSSLSDIERVYAHPQALAQCRHWLNRRLANVELIPSNSTAEAVKTICDIERAAAIGSKAAADLYGVDVLYPNIEDKRNNTTRFLVIGTIGTKPTGNDKTSILLSKSNEPGSLFKLLEPFATYGINMSKIESRPSQKQMWDYVFFIDFYGHAEDEKTKGLFNELEQRASLFKLLGSYPLPVG